MDYEKALAFAKDKHSGQYRKHGLEYISHPMRVVEILKTAGLSEESILIAGLFHDLLEDTDAKKEEVLHLSNYEILFIVEILTKENGYNMRDYMDRINNNPKAKLIKLADRISNLEDILFLEDIEFLSRYLKETQKYFLELSKGTVLEVQLVNALEELKEKLR